MNNNKNKSKHSLNKTIKKMVPAVFTALVATGIGFFALYTSPVPMIQDFGKMLTIGLIVSFILGVFILIPILFIRDYFFDNVQKKKSKHTKQGTGKTDKMLNWLTEKTIKLRWIIIAIAVILAAIGIWVDVDANAETDVETFMPQNTQELKDIHKLRDIVGTTDQVSIVYEGNDIISDDIMIWVDKLTEDMGTEFPDVVVETKSISNIVKQINDEKLPKQESLGEQIADIPTEQLKLFLNDTNTKGVITVGIKHLEAENLKVFIDDLRVYLNSNELDGVNTTITGKAVLDVEMIQGLTTGRYQMTLLGMGLVFFSLLLIYRERATFELLSHNSDVSLRPSL